MCGRKYLRSIGFGRFSVLQEIVRFLPLSTTKTAHAFAGLDRDMCGVWSSNVGTKAYFKNAHEYFKVD